MLGQYPRLAFLQCHSSKWQTGNVSLRRSLNLAHKLVHTNFKFDVSNKKALVSRFIVIEDWLYLQPQAMNLLNLLGR